MQQSRKKEFLAWNVVFLVSIDKIQLATDWQRRPWSAAVVRDDLFVSVSYCNVWRAGRGGGSRLNKWDFKAEGLYVCLCVCEIEHRAISLHLSSSSDETRQERGGRVKAPQRAPDQAGLGMLQSKCDSSIKNKDMRSMDSWLFHLFAPGGCKRWAQCYYIHLVFQWLANLWEITRSTQFAFTSLQIRTKKFNRYNICSNV